MGLEIERKFLVKNESWREQVDANYMIKQGYLSLDPLRTVRIRIKGKKAFITIKGKTVGISREEFEYEISYKDGISLLDMCLRPIVEKTRYLIKRKGFVWELDVFEGGNKGLIVAEIELEDENQKFEQPNWLGVEVSDDQRYFNASLINHPFKNW